MTNLSIEHIDRLKGMFFGLFVGDALGTTLEFKDRDTYNHITDMVGGGPFRLKPGEWTDDSSMALALAKTLIDHDPKDRTGFRIELLKNFTRWYRKGEFSHNGRCFDIGNTTSGAINRFIKSKGNEPYPASIDPMDSGNGGIMRLAPAVVYAYSHYTKDPSGESMVLSGIQSETTHASPDCMFIARRMGLCLSHLIEGYEWDNHKLFTGDRPKTRDEVKSDGYVINTWRAAGWAVDETTNFRDALLLAVNLGDDADTVGAVAGQLAGARYGFNAIPTEWVDVLAWRQQLDDYFNKLCKESV